MKLDDAVMRRQDEARDGGQDAAQHAGLSRRPIDVDAHQRRGAGIVGAGPIGAAERGSAQQDRPARR